MGGRTVLDCPAEPQPSVRSLIKDARPSSSDPVYDEQQRLDHQQAIRNFVLASNNLPRVELIELDSLTEEYRDNIAKTTRRQEEARRAARLRGLRRRKVICDLGAVEWLEEKLWWCHLPRAAELEGVQEGLEQQQPEASETAQPIEQSQPVPETPPAAPASPTA